MTFDRNPRTLLSLHRIGDTYPPEAELDAHREAITRTEDRSPSWTPDPSYFTDEEVVEMLVAARLAFTYARAARATALYLHVVHDMLLWEHTRRDYRYARRMVATLTSAVKARVKAHEKAIRLLRAAMK
jgi:hypothetical protein